MKLNKYGYPSEVNCPNSVSVSSTEPVNLKSFGINDAGANVGKTPLSSLDKTKVVGAKILIGVLDVLDVFSPKDKSLSYQGPIQPIPNKGETISI